MNILIHKKVDHMRQVAAEGSHRLIKVSLRDKVHFPNIQYGDRP